MTSGYELRDDSNNLTEVGICNSSDCDQFGWNIFRVSGLNTNVFCANVSCYGIGFQEVTADSNAYLLRVRTCKDDGFGLSNCLSHGWVDEYLGPNGFIENVICEPTGCIAGFTIEKIVDEKANLESAFAETEELIATKRAQFRAYVKTYKQPNQLLNKEIVELQQSLNEQRAAIRDSGGPSVVRVQRAECLSPYGCFTSGYILNDV